jgi:hypothetical protein
MIRSQIGCSGKTYCFHLRGDKITFKWILKWAGADNGVGIIHKGCNQNHGNGRDLALNQEEVKVLSKITKVKNGVFSFPFLPV